MCYNCNNNNNNNKVRSENRLKWLRDSTTVGWFDDGQTSAYECNQFEICSTVCMCGIGKQIPYDFRSHHGIMFILIINYVVFWRIIIDLWYDILYFVCTVLLYSLISFALVRLQSPSFLHLIHIFVCSACRLHIHISCAENRMSFKN